MSEVKKEAVKSLLVYSSAKKNSKIWKIKLFILIGSLFASYKLFSVVGQCSFQITAAYTAAIVTSMFALAFIFDKLGYAMFKKRQLAMMLATTSALLYMKYGKAYELQLDFADMCKLVSPFSGSYTEDALADKLGIKELTNLGGFMHGNRMDEEL